MFIVLTGVSGSGKTTVGKALARDLGWRFYEGDEFHSTANIEKMRRGEPLTDDDRTPWLEKLRSVIQSALEMVRTEFSHALLCGVPIERVCA